MQYIRLYGQYAKTVAVKQFTLEQIHAAKPSDGWTMRNIQSDAVKEFRLWEKDFVQSIVRSVVLKHCNQ